MEQILNRARFNRTGDLNLIDSLGLSSRNVNIIKNFIETGEAPDNMFTRADFSPAFVEEASSLVEVLRNKQTVQLVRIVSFALKNSNLVFVNQGEIIPLTEFFTAMYGRTEEELLNIIVSNEDLLEFINSFKLTIRQARVKHPYVASITNVKKDELNVTGAGIVFSGKIDNLTNVTKNWIKIAAFMDACIGISLGPSSSLMELVELLDSNMMEDFMVDKLYTQLVLVSLDKGITINDMYSDLDVKVIDYEEIYNSLGKVILVNKKGDYEYQDEEGKIVKVKGDDILNHIDF